MTDALLLASVFENFRNVSLSAYRLDPVHYISAPGLAWDAALRMTGVELEMLTDIEMYEFFEAGKRGGVSMITKRKSEAYNKYMSSYEGDEESTSQKYIISWDMNNLYGVAMKQKLPVSDFRFLSSSEIENFDVLCISENSEYGYVVECDLEYDEHYHHLHNDYPLAPERASVPYDSLSEYQKKLANTLELKYVSEQVKLIPHLSVRRKYKVHYRNLKYYLQNGMTMTKIHRVLTFKQVDWLAPYIDFNTEMRTKAKNKSESDYFKLMNNSVYGKGMENVRKRMSVRLVNKWEQAMRLIRKPQYMSHDVLSKNLCSFRMELGIVKLDKAVYTGFTVMDLSKLYMYQFHYGYVKQRYGQGAQLLFTDTDSLTYEITTCDLYKDMLTDIDLFDTHEYPKNHFLYSPVNKKVLGKMHDEANGDIVFKFIGLAPKVYCMVIGESEQSHEKKALRGVPKYIQEKSFKYDRYLKVLDEEQRVYCKMNLIRSFKHKISTVEVCKSVLHGFDSKRFIQRDGIHTLAWGHKQITEEE